jgi:hypothetical protein
MKLYFKLVTFVGGTLAWWGFIIPFLISAHSGILLTAGVAAIVAYPVMAYKLLETEIKNLKSKMENL